MMIKQQSPNVAQYGLAIHTTSPQLGLSISNFEGDERAEVWDLNRDLSTHLHWYLQEFIKPQVWSDLAWIAVAKGPGGFTGTRLGMVTARTLAQQLEIPLFAISSLDAIAWSPLQELQCAIAVEMPARREQVFTAIYQYSAQNRGLKIYLEDSTMTPEIWQQTLNNLDFPYHLITADSNLGNTVSSMLQLAHLSWQQGHIPHWSEALPFYGQNPV